MTLSPIPKGSQWFVDARRHGLGRKWFPSQSEAEKWCEIKEKELSKAGLQIAKLSNRDQLAALMAVENASRLGVTIEHVFAFYEQHNKPMVSIGIRLAVNQFLMDKSQSGKRERYTRQLGYTLGSLIEKVGENTSCDSITRSKIESWLHSNGWSNRTKSGYLIDVSTFFNYAVKKQWARQNPCANIEKIYVEDSPICILSIEEVRKLMDATLMWETFGKEKIQTHKAMLPYLTLAIFCGIRPAEIFRLSWDDIDLKHGHIKIEGAKSKTRQRRIVSISYNAHKWLELGKDLKLKPDGWQDKLNAIRKEAGVKWGHDCCRHSFVSYSLPIHGAAKTASEAGHSETILFKNYRELVKPQDAEAFWKIEPKTD